MTAEYTEELISFGEQQALLGVLCKPAKMSPSSPVLIVVNSGVLHRVGPCRLTVNMARQLADAGYAVFRFDYSGIGDSGFASESSDFEENNRRELIQAMDCLQSQLGSNRFVVHGLCSGARDAFTTALVDERITAISQVDGYSYRTRGYYWNKVKEKTASVSEFFGFAGRALSRALGVKSVDDAEDPDMSVREWPEYPERSVVEQGYAKLVARGVKLLVIYTGAWADTYNYQSQFYDMYPGVNFGSCLNLLYLPDADHVMTDSAHSKQLVMALQGLLGDQGS